MKYNINLDLSVINSQTIILKEIQPNSKVLEFGPSTGYMTRYMKQQLNCDVTCIEIDPKSAMLTKEYCNQMIVGDVDEMNWVNELNEKKFDYIIFADVLEHLKNPWKVLKESAQLLESKGVVVTSIPNITHNAIIMEIIKGEFNYQHTGLLDNTHLRFFGKKNIRELLINAGLAPIKWYTTMLRPENTEFKQDIESLPKEIYNYLNNREEGNVYQFITVSMKANEVEKEVGTFIEKNGEAKFYMDEEYLQVFWGEDKQYREENSVKKTLIIDGNSNTYELMLPKEAKGYLRIDPAIIPLYGEIDSICITEGDEYPKVLAEWSTANNFNGLIGLNDIIRISSNNDRYSFFSTGLDPQIIINNYYLDGKSEKKIVITCLFQKNQSKVFNLISETVKKLFCEMKQWKDSNLSLQEELKKIKLVAKDLSNKIEELNKKNEIKQIKLDVSLQNEEKLIKDIDLYTKKIHTLETGIDTLSNEISKMKQTRSWKYTYFLRWLSNKFK